MSAIDYRLSQPLEVNLRILVDKFDELYEEYNELKHPDSDRECEMVYYGKSQAFWYARNELRNLVDWYDGHKK